MKRIKIKLPHLSTRDEAESVMTDLAERVNSRRRAVADRDAKILEINRAYEISLSNLDEQIRIKTETLRAWAETNPDQFPKGRKSIDFVSGVLGFRTGTPKLALLNRSWNWEKVTSAVAAILPGFIRNKPEVDREAIIAQRDELAEFLPTVGVKVTQDESFFIEPSLADTDARQVQKAQAA